MGIKALLVNWSSNIVLQACSYTDRTSKKLRFHVFFHITSDLFILKSLKRFYENLSIILEWMCIALNCVPCKFLREAIVLKKTGYTQYWTNEGNIDLEKLLFFFLKKQDIYLYHEWRSFFLSLCYHYIHDLSKSNDGIHGSNEAF